MSHRESRPRATGEEQQEEHKQGDAVLNPCDISLADILLHRQLQASRQRHGPPLLIMPIPSRATMPGIGSSPSTLSLQQTAMTGDLVNSILLRQLLAPTLPTPGQAQRLREAHLRQLSLDLQMTQLNPALMHYTAGQANPPLEPPLVATSRSSALTAGVFAASDHASEAPQPPSAPPSSTDATKAAKLLVQLGSTLRGPNDAYVDVSRLIDLGTIRRDADELFPTKLHRMLRETKANGQTDIVGFLPHGRAFSIYQRDRFMQEILPRYFATQTQWTSFAKQLSLYNFRRVQRGRDTGAFYHELFLRGRESLAQYMRRVGAPRTGQDRRRLRPTTTVEDPDFYAMEPLPPIS